MKAKWGDSNRKHLDDYIKGEVTSQLKAGMIETIKREEKDFLAIIGYTLFEKYGWGKKRITNFLDNMHDGLNELSEWYGMTSTDQAFLCTMKMEELGVDLNKYMESVDDIDNALERGLRNVKFLDKG